MFETLITRMARLFGSAPKFHAGEVTVYTQPNECQKAGVIGAVRFVRPNNSKKWGWFYNLTLIELGGDAVVRVVTYVYTVPEASLHSAAMPS